MQGVVSDPSPHEVPATATAKQVVAAVSLEVVHYGATEERVVTVVPVNPVHSTFAANDVRCGTAVELVPVGPSGSRVLADPAKDRVWAIFTKELVVPALSV